MSSTIFLARVVVLLDRAGGAPSASASEALGAQVANGTYRVARSISADKTRPFLECWEVRIPEVTESDLWGPEAMPILV